MGSLESNQNCTFDSRSHSEQFAPSVGLYACAYSLFADAYSLANSSELEYPQGCNALAAEIFAYPLSGTNAADTQIKQDSRRKFELGITLDIPPLFTNESARDVVSVRDANLQFDQLFFSDKEKVIAAGAQAFGSTLLRETSDVGVGIIDGLERFGVGLCNAASIAVNAGVALSEQNARVTAFQTHLANDSTAVLRDAIQVSNDVSAIGKSAHNMEHVASCLWENGAAYVSNVGDGKANPLADIGRVVSKAALEWDALPSKEKAARGVEAAMSLVPLEAGAIACETIVVAAKSMKPMTKFEELNAEIGAKFAKVDAQIAESNLRFESGKYSVRRMARGEEPPHDADGSFERRVSRSVDENTPEARQLRIGMVNDMTVSIGDVQAWRLEAVKSAIVRLPQQDLEDLHAAGYKIVVTNSLSEASEFFPARFRSGNNEKIFVREHESTTHALTVFETRTMILHNKDHARSGVVNSARHEFAHALADIRKWEENLDLRDMHEGIVNDLKARFSSIGKSVMFSDLNNYHDLTAYRNWFQEDGVNFNEVIADLYAIDHGGSRNPQIDRIIVEQFAQMLEVMRAANWHR